MRHQHYFELAITAGAARFFAQIPRQRNSPASGPGDTSVMIEEFAIISVKVPSEFLNLNYTSESMIPVSLMIAKFAPYPGGKLRGTSESEH